MTFTFHVVTLHISFGPECFLFHTYYQLKVSMSVLTQTRARIWTYCTRNAEDVSSASTCGKLFVHFPFPYFFFYGDLIFSSTVMVTSFTR